MPAAIAVVTAAVRSLTPSFGKVRSRWVFTVASLMCSSRPISALDSPRATSRSTSTSRGDSDSWPLRAAVEQLGRHGRRQHGLAARGQPYRLHQVGPRGVLEQVARRARLDGAQDVGVGLVGGEHDDPGARHGFEQPRGGVDAVQPRHPQVHQHHVGGQRAGRRDGLLARARLADHHDVGLAVEHAAHTRPYDRMVVHQQHRDHAVGTSTRTVVPVPGTESTRSVPETCSTRPRMAASPYPPPVSAPNPLPSSRTVSVTDPS